MDECCWLDVTGVQDAEGKDLRHFILEAPVLTAAVLSPSAPACPIVYEGFKIISG